MPNCLVCNDTGWEVVHEYLPKGADMATAKAQFTSVDFCTCEHGKALKSVYDDEDDYASPLVQ